MSLRFLDLIKPFTPLLPEVSSPETKITFQQRLIWTGVSIPIARSTSPYHTRAASEFVHKVNG
ncbi:hypothetical protein P152DRAFT_458860 [Eremomyces bilateralis CBS 781.70]|uniref:Uncharacterized protein n=1 Tax=Eremomyces bilateralis CBS 781.70 TaxID=1392243 RepID=A0A6G1G1H5_9PEZI|nr:uncharacterized protein P152DRAFT_458860 [Eremomyces bilateralis CBS 781.70]KAF1811904.1 hypothetical protein P152DRAFT_458860 [Eremomyces bilateralis CBS 781.70]